jgi:hypothetical protein
VRRFAGDPVNAFQINFFCIRQPLPRALLQTHTHITTPVSISITVPARSRFIETSKRAAGSKKKKKKVQPARKQKMPSKVLHPNSKAEWLAILTQGKPVSFELCAARFCGEQERREREREQTHLRLSLVFGRAYFFIFVKSSF